ncbi:hypothetical protein [Streptomyces sp. KL118A]|uniref:hypothetical protein n=1 Tax=Streptomyces sp. KL118A TaxID=3045153 RepID=UPI00278BAF83|nr:hypothetical protein [Streptomyces sp. KL118A]
MPGPGRGSDGGGDIKHAELVARFDAGELAIEVAQRLPLADLAAVPLKRPSDARLLPEHAQWSRPLGY